MAEGSKLDSIRDGSDAVLEFTCTPCREGDAVQGAVKYCPECQEFLCKSCVIHHSRFKATRSHVLTNTEHAHQGYVFAEVAKCLYHADRVVEMYCSAHDMVYCAMCIATEHRFCTEVTKIEQSSKSSECGQNEFKLLQAETKTILDSLRATKEKRLENVKTLKKDSEEVTTKIHEMENNLTEYIQKLKRNAIDALKVRHDETRSRVESDVTAILDMIEKLEKMKQISEIDRDADATQRFVVMKQMQQIATDAKDLHDRNTQACTSLSLCFQENEDLSQVLKGGTTLGEVTAVDGKRNKISSTNKLIELKSVKEINVNMKTGEKGLISDVCQLSDGTIILTDHANQNVKRLDENYSIKDCLTLDARPTAVCCIRPDTIAVKTNNNKIQFITVGSSLSVQNCISIAGGGVYGFAYYFEQFWVSNGYLGVKVYSKAGTPLNSFVKTRFKCQHIAVDRGTIYVTGGNEGVFCFNINGSVLKELRDSRLNNNCGVCVSPDGVLFLSGKFSRNVVMFSRDGECLGELVAGLRQQPVSLCYDKRKNNIIATTEKGIISIIELQ